MRHSIKKSPTKRRLGTVGSARAPSVHDATPAQESDNTDFEQEEDEPEQIPKRPTRNMAATPRHPPPNRTFVIRLNESDVFRAKVVKKFVDKLMAADGNAFLKFHNLKQKIKKNEQEY